MKRSRAEAGNMVMNKRLTGLALITGMVLLFASGISIAGTEFTLYQKPSGGEKYAALEYLKDSESEKSIQWLVKDTSQESVVKFVTAFSVEPFKFVEGIKAALKSVDGDEAKAKFKVDLKKSLDDVSGPLFGSTKRKLALMDLASKLLEAKDLDKDELLKDLFNQDAKDELALKNEIPEEKVVEKEKPKVEGEGQKSLLDALADIKKAFLDSISGKPTVTEKPTEKPTEVGSNPNTTTTVQNPVNPNANGVGEKNNAAMEKLVNAVCEQVPALQASAQAQFAALSKQAADAVDGLNNIFNQNAIQQRLNGQNQKKNNIDDVLPAVLASLTDNGKQNNNVTPPPPVQQLAQNQPRQNDRGDNQALPPVPQQDPNQQQQQQQVPFQQNLPVLADNTPIRVATGRLPISDGIQELDRAESIAQALEHREPYTKQIAMLGPNVSSSALVSPISKLDADINRTQSAMTVALNKAKSLDRSLERLKEGGRAALSDADKKKEKQYQLEYDELKGSFDQEKQMIQNQVQQVAQSGGDSASYQVQANQYLTQKMQALGQAKKRKEQFDAELEQKVESLNGEIKTLASQRDDLKSAGADLEGKLASLKSEQGQLTQLYTAALGREFGGQPGNQVAQGSSNQQRTMAFGGSGAPRTNAPGRLMRQPQTAAVPTSNDPMRGSLSSKGAM